MRKNFTEVQELIVKFANIVGFYEFNDENHVPSKKEVVRRYFCHLIVFVFLGCCATTSLFVDSSLGLKIISGLIAQVPLLSVFLTSHILSKSRRKYLELFQWCQSIYNVRTDSFIDQSIVRRLDNLNDRSMKIVKLLAKICIVDAFLVTFVAAFIGHFLPDTIYPDFQPPLPILLPIQNRNNWAVFLTTVTMQFGVSLVTILLWNIVVNVIVVVSLHIHGYLDVVLIIITEVKSLMENNGETKQILAFQNLIKLTVDLTCDAHR